MKLAILLLVTALLASAAVVEKQEETDYQAKGWRLIQLHHEMPAIWMDPITVNSLPFQFQNDNWFFQDITAHPKPTMNKHKKINYPTQLYQQALVNEMLNTSNPNRAWNDLTTLSAFQNRYYTSTYGQQSSQWIYEHVQDIITANGRSSDTSVSLFTHVGWPQRSIIATIRPANGNDETVILGAHCDSIASGMPNGRAPGADDDGSGTVNLIEVFRILMENNYRPTRTLEIQWYAAEELGLLGSDDIAEQYADEGRNVVGQYQQDMNSYNPNGNAAFRIMFDRMYMDQELTDFVHLLANYTSLSVTEGSYGYAASDHASFARHGFPASHAKESTSYPPIHTANDLMSNLDREYMWEFVGPALGFAVELTSSTALDL